MSSSYLALGLTVIGLNLVAGTPRALSLEEAANLATVGREKAPLDPALAASTRTASGDMATGSPTRGAKRA